MSKQSKQFWLGVAGSLLATVMFEVVRATLSASGILKANLSSWGVHAYIILVSFATYMVGLRYGRKATISNESPTAQDVLAGVSIVSAGEGPAIYLGIARLEIFHFHACNRLGTLITIKDLKLTIFMGHQHVMDVPAQAIHTDLGPHSCTELTFGVDLNDPAKHKFGALAIQGQDHQILSLRGVAYLTAAGKNFQININQESGCRIHEDPEAVQY